MAVSWRMRSGTSARWATPSSPPRSQARRSSRGTSSARPASSGPTTRRCAAGAGGSSWRSTASAGSWASHGRGPRPRTAVRSGSRSTSPCNARSRRGWRRRRAPGCSSTRGRAKYWPSRPRPRTTRTSSRAASRRASGRGSCRTRSARSTTVPSRAFTPRIPRSRSSWPSPDSRAEPSRRVRRCRARDRRTTTGGTFSAGRRAGTARWRCTARSPSRATCSSIGSARSPGSTPSTSMATCWAWAGPPASTFPARGVASCRRRNGSRRSAGNRGTPGTRSRSRSGRACWRSRQSRWRP